jgi:5,10-methylenetetrahydromethanopterin reductase
LRWEVRRADIPFLLGSWGEATIRACLPYITEIKLGGTANPAIVARMRQFVDRTCRAVGRDPASVSIVVGAVSVAARDRVAARALAKRQVALYLPVVAKLDPTLAIEPPLLARLEACAAQYDFETAAELIADELLVRVALAGTPEEIAAQAHALLDAGAERVEFGTPHGISEEEGIKLLALVLKLVRD